MAGRKVRASKSAVALTAATAKTAVQGKAVSACLRLLRLTGGFNGTSTTNAPVLLELVRQTSGGTMSALTPQLADNGIAYTILSTWQHTANVEPTDSGAVIWATYLHPQSSGIWLFSDEDVDDIVNVGTWIGLRATAADNVSCTFDLDVEE